MVSPKKSFGIGSLSILLVLFAILWAFSFEGFCFGDLVLNRIGLKAWTNGNTGIHITVYYSLIFLFPAFYIGKYNTKHYFAKIGKMLSLLLGGFIILSVFGLSIR